MAYKLKKYGALTMTAAVLVTMTGCSFFKYIDNGGNREPELVHYLHDGDNLTLRYFEDLDYTGIKYEEIAWQTNDRLAVGPTEPWYAGVLYVGEDEAEDLWDKYEWEECSFPDIELYDVEVKDIESSTWYSSNDFNSVISEKGVQVDELVFNGSEIVFYLKTT